MSSSAPNNAAVLPGVAQGNSASETRTIRSHTRTRSSVTQTTGVSSTTAILQQRSERWVEWLRIPALIVFLLIPTVGFSGYKYTPRIVWTMAVAVLPLFIVLAGYHRWRRICPLAVFSRIPAWLGWSGSRVIPNWLERNYYYIPVAFFIFGLWARHVATNGDGVAIAVFFSGIALTAFVTGTLYSGKSWCNYVCPLVFIEKIYTEPQGLRETANSQCVKCTACKKYCPDINQENNYWKELDWFSKKVAYLVFPGLVFGFYFYYYLQSGTWEYYFGGSWTAQPGLWRVAFSPGVPGNPDTYGFYFWHELPRAVASLLTLAGCGLFSFALFSALEIPLGALLCRRDPDFGATRVRHVLFTIASFCAFVTFYSFAGAPTLRLITSIPHFFLIIVVLTASIYLARRYGRTPRAFAEETLARNIVKRWEWPEPVPADLHDAFLIHSVRAKESQRASERSLEIYQDSVREALADGIVKAHDVSLLASLRNQLSIKETDHEVIMAALAEEERALLNDPSRRLPAEKRLQLQNYSLALETYLDRAMAGGKPDDALMNRFREEYRVTPEEHGLVLEDILGGARGIGTRLADTVTSIERSACTIAALELEPSPAHDLLRDVLERRRERAIQFLVRGLAVNEALRLQLASGLASARASDRTAALESLNTSIAPTLCQRLLTAQRTAAAHEEALPTLQQKLKERTASSDPYVRALAIFLTGQGASGTGGSEAAVVRETLHLVKSQANSGIISRNPATALSTVEKMIALRTAPIFARLEPESLERLARSCREARYVPGDALCIENERGNEVFILVDGEVEVVKGSGEDKKFLATEKAGGFIGELAVIDSAPRSATVLAGPNGARALCLNGEAFRDALNQDAGIATAVMRTLAQRLKQRNG